MPTTFTQIIDEIETSVKNHSDIGIFCSGGFDSTLLCYLIFKFASEHQGKKITVYTVPRTDDSKSHAKRIVNYISNLYPTVDYHEALVGNPTLHHGQQVRSGLVECWSHSSTLLVLGDTALPPNDLADSGPVRKKSAYERVYQPLIDFDKTVSILIANHLGILNEISSITHTCTESITLRCNKCWQCRERAWAFSTLDLIDVGTM